MENRESGEEAMIFTNTELTEQGKENLRWENRNVYFEVLARANAIIALLNTKHGNRPHSPYLSFDVIKGQLVLHSGDHIKPRQSFVDVKSVNSFGLYRALLQSINDLKNILGSNYRDIEVVDQNNSQETMSDEKSFSMTSIISKVKNDLMLGEKQNINKHENIVFHPQYKGKEISLLRGMYNLLGVLRMEYFIIKQDGNGEYLSLSTEGSRQITFIIKDIRAEYKARGIHECEGIFSKEHLDIINSKSLLFSEKQLIALMEDLSAETGRTREERENKGLFMNMVAATFDQISQVPYEEAQQLEDMMRINLFKALDIDQNSLFAELRVKKNYSLSMKVMTKPETKLGTDLVGARTIFDAESFIGEEQRNETVIKHFDAIVQHLTEMGKEENMDNPLIRSFTIESIQIDNKGVLPKGSKMNAEYVPSQEEQKLLENLQIRLGNTDKVKIRSKKKLVSIKKDIIPTSFMKEELSDEKLHQLKLFMRHFDVGKTGSNGEYSDSKIIVSLSVVTHEGKIKHIPLERQVIWSDNNNLVGAGNHCFLESQKVAHSFTRQSVSVKGDKLLLLIINSLKTRAEELKKIYNDIQDALGAKKTKTYYTKDQYDKENDLSFTGVEGTITEFDAKALADNKSEEGGINKLHMAAESLFNKDLEEQRLVRYASAEELRLGKNERPAVLETERPTYKETQISLQFGEEGKNLKEDQELTSEQRKQELQQLDKRLNELVTKEKNKQFRSLNIKNNLLLGRFEEDRYFVIPHPEKKDKGLAIQASVLAYIVSYQEHAGN